MLYVGYVYRFYCLTSQKNYIGITTQDINRRWDQHKNESLGKQVFKDTHFHRAIRRYGWDNFERTILLRLESDSEEQLLESLNQLEQYYIQKYDSYNNGYNSTKGGKGVISHTTQRKVIVFNELGEYIDTCNSRVEASKKYDVMATSVSDCCTRTILSAGWFNNLRLVFRDEGDTVTQEDIKKIQRARKNKPVPVRCYDYNTGQILGEYSSIIEAQSKTGVDADSISKCSLHKIKSTIQGGKKLVWRKLDDAYTPKYIVEAFCGEFSIGRYVSLAHAADVFGIQANHISEYLNGKRKSAGKYKGENIIWKRL